MENNCYKTNRQKLLFMVNELHKRGFGNLRIIPSLSPSGMYWRCSFVNQENDRNFNATNWLGEYETENLQEIKQTPSELAELFVKENIDFIKYCKGENDEYVKWYEEMVNGLDEGELPYAYAEYFSPTDFWKTSSQKTIKTLSDEKNTATDKLNISSKINSF